VRFFGIGYKSEKIVGRHRRMHIYVNYSVMRSVFRLTIADRKCICPITTNGLYGPQLISQGSVFLKNLTRSVTQLVRKFSPFWNSRIHYRARRTYKWATRSKSSKPASWKSTLILFSHLCTCLPNILFVLRSANTLLPACLISPRRGKCPAHLVFLTWTQNI
jgi:hypothetical protein